MQRLVVVITLLSCVGCHSHMVTDWVGPKPPQVASSSGEPVDVSMQVFYSPSPRAKDFPVRIGRKVEARVDFCVTIEGKTTEVTVAEAPDREVGKAIADAVRKWRFKPALASGEPVETCVSRDMELERVRGPWPD